ncbi:MAG: hypothetical protein JNJ41_14445 [Bacteroidia bacterium]|nr:hypothetical protein [Bacteroidia bacterium]
MHPSPFHNYLIRPMQQNDAAAFFKMVEVNRPRLESGFAGTVSKTKTLQATEEFIANNTANVRCTFERGCVEASPFI